MSGLGAKFEESLQMQPGNWPASKKIVFNGQIGHEKYAYCFQKHLCLFLSSLFVFFSNDVGDRCLKSWLR